MGDNGYAVNEIKNITVTSGILALIDEIDEFKGR